MSDKDIKIKVIGKDSTDHTGRKWFGKSCIVTLDQIISEDWNMEAYFGDNWIDQFRSLKIGQRIDTDPQLMEDDFQRIDNDVLSDKDILMKLELSRDELIAITTIIEYWIHNIDDNDLPKEYTKYWTDKNGSRIDLERLLEQIPSDIKE